MTATPELTAEQIVYGALGQCGMLLGTRENAARDAVERLRAAGLLGGDTTEDQIAEESWSRFAALDPDYASVTYPAEAMRDYNRAAFVSGARWAASHAAAGVAPKERSALMRLNELLGLNILAEVPSFRADIRVDFDEHGNIVAAEVSPQEPSDRLDWKRRAETLRRKWMAAEERAQELFEKYAEHAEHVQVEAWSMDCIDGDCEHRDDDGKPEDLSACPSAPMEVCVDCMEIAGAGHDPKQWEERLSPWPCEHAKPATDPDREKLNGDDRAMQIAREIARMHTFTSADALSIANAALALADAPVVDEAKPFSVTIARTARQAGKYSVMVEQLLERAGERDIEVRVLPPEVDEVKLAEVLARVYDEAAVESPTDYPLQYEEAMQHGRDSARAVVAALRGGGR